MTSHIMSDDPRESLIGRARHSGVDNAGVVPSIGHYESTIIIGRIEVSDEEYLLPGIKHVSHPL